MLGYKRTSGDSSDKMTAPRVSTCITFAVGKDGEDMCNDDSDSLDNSVGIQSCSTESISVNNDHPAFQCISHEFKTSPSKPAGT